MLENCFRLLISRLSFSRTEYLKTAFLIVFFCLGIQNGYSAAVRLNHVRFEFLTPSLVRMEYAPSGHFVNASTAVIQKRKWAEVNVRTVRKNGWLIAKTSKMTVRYQLHSGAFKSDNLKVTWRDSTGTHSWHPGQKDSLNLGGLPYSLDQARRGALPNKKHGLLSRNGYTLIKDSRTPVWNAKKQWIQPRQQKNNQDWYLFTYGHNYRKVLHEYAELSGSIPMIPRYTLGPWITDMNFEYFPNSYQSKQPRFKNYNEHHLKQEVLKFRRNHIPLDVLVMDFGWHNYGWQGGYDWSPLIPHPKLFLHWLHDHGVHVSLNDHPGYSKNMSVLSYKDSHAPEVLRDLGKSMPPKPSFTKSISAGWKFATDPHNRGVNHQWYSVGNGPSHWQAVKLGRAWNHQGHKNYTGIGWYRRSVQLPENLPDSLYLYVGQVSNQFQVFINGHQVSHSKPKWWHPLTYTNISPYVKAGQANEIAVRVVSKHGPGGITRTPVALKSRKPPKPIHFDLSNKKQAEVFMNDLHKPLIKEGVDFWWIDGGSGAVNMPGLNKQMWTNRVYYEATKQETGKRSFIFSRYGSWGSQRYPAFFTGDTHSQWPVLGSEVALTARGGNVLMPYITHDIGGFHGANINFDLYARWVEFGTFSPILRLHSAHENPHSGNVRMPWKYGKKGMKLAKKYFQLREKLIPYIYTYTRLAHTTAVPLLRPLYLQYPNLDAAYRHPHEYFFGKQMLVAPIIHASGQRTIYLPPGNWINYFTGQKYQGNHTFTAHFKVDQIPVFVRSGSVIPEQPSMPYTNAHPLNTIVVNIFGPGHGTFKLYNDDGISFKFQKGKYAWTKISYNSGGDGSHHIVIHPTTGSFKRQVKKRAYRLRIHSITRPQSIVVDGHRFNNWQWKPNTATVKINLPKKPIRKKISINLK